MREPSSWRVIALISALEARRWLNRGPFLRRTPSKRGATRRKGAPAKLLLLVVSLVLGLNVLFSTTAIVHGVAKSAERATAPGDAFVPADALAWLDRVAEGDVDPTMSREQALDEAFRYLALDEVPSERDDRAAALRALYERRGRAAFHATRVGYALWPSPGLWFDAPARMLPPLALVGFLLALSVLCFSVVGSDRDLARSDATLEWWFSFPVPTRALLLARLFGTALVNPFAWLLLAPFFYVVFACAGRGDLLAVASALAATLYLTTLGGCLRVLAETGLRRYLTPRRIAHVQAALEVLAGLPLLAAFGASSKIGLETLIAHSQGVPRGALYTPLSLPFAWLLPHGALAALGCALALAGAVLTSVTIGSAWLREGLVSASEPVLGSRARRPVAAGRTRSLLRSLAHRERLAIGRDPARIARVVLFPLILVAISALGDRQLLRAIVSEPQHASAAAFSVACIVLVGGGLTSLANEGPGLWLFYTAPWSLDAILARRATLWAALAGALALVALTVIAAIAHDARFVFSGYSALAFAGIALYGYIAVALGALGTDVMESARARRIQAFTPQLFMLLAGMFTFALYSPSAWQKFAQLALSALFAFALWQKLRDHTPYFLDPTEAPPPAIAVSDGIFAALAFFVLQGLLGLLFAKLGFSPGLTIVFAFAGAGLLVSAGAIWSLFRLGVPSLARTLGLATLGSPLRTVALGVGGGVLAGAGARLYLELVRRIDWLRALYEESERMEPNAEQLRWLAVLAVVAAPLCEELLFRGILYRGFRRSLRTPQAVLASALVFALVHPATSFAPVFVMALCAATAFELSGSLFAAILTHMIYNGIAIALALQR